MNAGMLPSGAEFRRSILNLTIVVSLAGLLIVISSLEGLLEFTSEQWLWFSVMVVGYGAAGKGNTLLNFCGIRGTYLIRFVVDASPHKQNKFLPGSLIPVAHEDEINRVQPDYIIILRWNLIWKKPRRFSLPWPKNLRLFCSSTIAAKSGCTELPPPTLNLYCKLQSTLIARKDSCYLTA